MDSKKIHLKFFQNQHHTYLEILTWYRSEIGWFFKEEGKEIHTVPFVLTCASALECSLNDYFTRHCLDSYKEQGQLLLPGILSMTLKGKMLNIVPLLTRQKYMINVEHKVYQILVELIKVRNKLVHNKSEYETCEAVVSKENDEEFLFDISEEFKNRLEGKIDPTLGVTGDIGRFHDALEEFHSLFFDIYKNDEFKGNELIIELESKQIK